MSKTLLVVDDAAIIRAMLSDTMNEAGWTVVGEAGNGQEAIDRYAELRPDAVTLDLVMPEFDGRHALKGILKMDPEAKIIVVSALNQKEILKQAFKLGAIDFVVKPFDKRTLVATLDNLLPATASA